MGKARDLMVEELRLSGYSDGTQDAYLRSAKKFVAHFMRPPEVLSEDEVRGYFVHMLENGASRSTQKMHLAAVKFLYARALKTPEIVQGLRYPKVPVPVPDVLSGTEVLDLLDAMTSLKHQVAVMTAYSCGLRVSEVCVLQTCDIDGKRMLIKVREGKGGKGRYVPLAQRLLWTLREYWRATRPAGSYLFPSKRDPHEPMTTRSLEKAVRVAAEAAGLDKRVTPHVLRHTFASHMLQMGADIRQIQLVLGHQSIQTTARYTHMSPRHIAAVGSPLDALGTPEGEPLG